MMTMTRKRSLSALAMVGIVGLGLSACGGDDAATPGESTSSTSSSSMSPSMSPTESSMSPTESMGTENASTTPVGPGCADYASQVPSGAGSVQGMAQDNVTTAASNNPLLKTLTAAVSGQLNSQVNLVDTLNGGQFTVFAPVDDAFAKLDAATVDKLKTPEGAQTLSTVLTYHVVQGKMTPEQLESAKTVKTVQGGDLTIGGTADAMTVNGSTNVICGNVQTSNATVYLIDSVLMPSM